MHNDCHFWKEQQKETKFEGVVFWISEDKVSLNLMDVCIETGVLPVFIQTATSKLSGYSRETVSAAEAAGMFLLSLVSSKKEDSLLKELVPEKKVL